MSVSILDAAASNPFDPSSTKPKAEEALPTPPYSSPSSSSSSASSSSSHRSSPPSPVPFSPSSTGDYDSTLLPPLPRGESVSPLSIDANTPDHWIARDERLIRLTGKHPYNVEPPLSALFSHGFLTPQHLFYVRTHGATPRVTASEAAAWKLRVHGLVERERTFTLAELRQTFETVTLPITLVCAGNRRKEQNMVAKGLGFNWGAAGVSTGLFTGVYLADVLEHCRPCRPLLSSFPRYDQGVAGRARHVVFEGADQLPKGKYGTSQRLGWAMDRTKGMLLAWGLNGEDLSPDHGFPLRLVVPGQIGGRMVKWLDRIEVSDRESQHHLHFYDNKVLPTEVTAEQARNEDHWWHDPKYIINELNVNAAVCSPAHDQVVALPSPSSPSPSGGTAEADAEPFAIEGYAYTGGGRRIDRVEVSLDEGRSWTSAEVTFPEDLYRLYPLHRHPYLGRLDLSETEMSFAWCFWRLPLDLRRDVVERGVRSVSVRAIDEALATMPRDMYWNAMSMMNAWWFRVAVHTDAQRGTVRFEHPTVPGNAEGGWMQRMNQAGLDPRNPVFARAEANSQQAGGDAVAVAAAAAAAPPSADPASTPDERSAMVDPAKQGTVITAAELAQHADAHGTGGAPWFVVHGEVYDGGGFLQDHPGGEDSIRLVAGEDATEDFMAIHSIDAKRMLRDYHLGRLAVAVAAPRPQPTLEADASDPTHSFLDPKRWRSVRLVSKRAVSHDAWMFRFALAHPEQELGLAVGQHVFLRAKARNAQTGAVETVQRAYTPYSGNAQRGYVEILIKVYRSAGGFAGGRMTTLLDALQPGPGLEGEVGSTLELKGPVGSFTYLGHGAVRWKPVDRIRRVRRLAMVAGGSGITPIWSTLKAIVDEQQQQQRDAAAAQDEGLEVWIVYANRTQADILIREELDRVKEALGARCHLWYVLSQVREPEAATWEMGRGYADLECLRQHLPPPPPTPPPQRVGEEDALEDTLALVCGPPAMEKTVAGALETLGWDVPRTVVFF